MDFFSTDELIIPAKGDLLISEPYLPDPNFERTVVFLCEHDENGSMGYVLNRPASVGLEDVIDELSGVQSDLFVGGPVEQDTLHFLHRCNDLKTPTNQIINEVHWGGSFEKLTTLVNTHQILVNDVRFFLGYSGWGSGQLLSELKEKSWIVFKNATSAHIFDTKPENLWKQVLNEMGGKFKLISNYPTDPRLN